MQEPIRRSGEQSRLRLSPDYLNQPRTRRHISRRVRLAWGVLAAHCLVAYLTLVVPSAWSFLVGSENEIPNASRLRTDLYTAAQVGDLAVVARLVTESRSRGLLTNQELAPAAIAAVERDRPVVLLLLLNAQTRDDQPIPGLLRASLLSDSPRCTRLFMSRGYRLGYKEAIALRELLWSPTSLFRQERMRREIRAIRALPLKKWIQDALRADWNSSRRAKPTSLGTNGIRGRPSIQHATPGPGSSPAASPGFERPARTDFRPGSA